MTVKKILLVPAEGLIEEKPGLRPAAFFIGAAKYIKRKIHNLSVYDGELQFYADMPTLLGRENVFLLGEYYPHFYEKNVPENSAYPSCHGIPRPTTVTQKEAEKIINKVDVVIVSTRAGERGRILLSQARKRDIPAALLDFKDHAAIFGVAVGEEEICRGFKHKEDYDLYFKKDLPLGRKTDYILPIAPVPVRPESYRFRSLPKDVDIFYSGKPRIKSRGDRAEVAALAKNNFDKALVLEHGSRETFLTISDYLDNLSRAKIALSPSGIVWDSFRHCEVGLAPKTALLAPKPYMEVVGPFLEDGRNAILYDTEFRDGKYHLTGEDELVEKIKYYLANPDEREGIANAWGQDVKNGHTGLARARYIIGSIEDIA